MSRTGSAADRAGRIAALDMVRALALAGMFVFHLTWDLAYFRMISPEAPFRPAFVLFGHAVASTFLALVGISLVLALPGGRADAAYWRRLALVVAAAASISVATYVVFPDTFVFFGILHVIAVGSLLALPFLRAPPWLTLIAAAIWIALPFAVASSVFDAPLLWWVGLGTREPPTVDWRPVFPWVGVVLAGVAGARWAQRRGIPAVLQSWRPRNAATRGAAWAGRHSLLVYLIHQPIFLAALFVVAQAMSSAAPVADSGDASPFLSSCAEQCIVTGADAGLCRNVCGCVSTQVRRQADVWQRLVTDALSPADRERIDAFTKQCVGNAPR